MFEVESLMLEPGEQPGFGVFIMPDSCLRHHGQRERELRLIKENIYTEIFSYVVGNRDCRIACGSGVAHQGKRKFNSFSNSNPSLNLY
jgi:hypothetical protein